MVLAPPAQKISLYSLSDLKTQTDDLLPHILTSLPGTYKFRQSHVKTDVRLSLSSMSVIIAGVLFVADWKLGWDDTKAYTPPACLAYFVIQGLLTAWSWFAEKGSVFEGKREGGQSISLYSSTSKHIPIYTLNITYLSPSGQPFPIASPTITGNFADWFNLHGYIDRPAFRRWLAGNVEVVGLALPEDKKAYEAEQQKQIEDGEVDDEVVSEGAIRAGATTSRDSFLKGGRGRGADMAQQGDTDDPNDVFGFKRKRDAARFQGKSLDDQWSGMKTSRTKK